ncbi:MAG TPA: sulfite exporter TauE/SafE family protein [Vicinamibacterales bacterium]|nr:sulfite exporter TauE/SafE family protein [Vicinamibacterales bacterium]
MEPKNILILLLIAIAIAYHAFWYFTERQRRGSRTAPTKPRPLAMGIAFVANFFDTLGIGSYATTTSMSKLWNVMPDERIPGTLNVGYVLATVVQAVIFMTIIEVDFTTLVCIIGAAVLGAFSGAGVVAGLSRRQVQLGMGTALLVASGLMVLSMSGQGPAPGEALGLSGAKLGIAIVISFVLGALMMLGIGFYGPCLIMISLLGMDPRVSYPIMMGACAFLMPAGSVQFIKKGSYDLRTAIAFLIAGPLAVFIAAPLVDRIPLFWLRILVLVVVLYTAIRMLTSAAQERAATRPPAPAV